MTLTPTRRRFTADEYHRMAEAGILREDDRVEPPAFPDRVLSADELLG